MHASLVSKLGENLHVYPHQLEENYPRILENIIGLWGTPELEGYFNELMFDERGNRHGFPENILMELFKLYNYYRSTHPRPPGSTYVWSDEISPDEEPAK